MAVATDINVGDIWRGWQSSHNGWQIKITKVTPQNVRYDLVGGPANGKRAHRNLRGDWLPIYVIERNFTLVRAGGRKEHAVAIVERNDVVPQHQWEQRADGIVWTAVDVDHRVCKSCGEDKPQSDFDSLPSRAGVLHSLHTCHACMVAKRAAGIRASFAAKQALAALETEAVISDQPTPTIEASVPRPSLSAALLELAAQAEDLEHSPVYRALAASVDTLLAARTDAGPVAVVPMALVEHLVAQVQAAHTELDTDPE